MHDYDPIFPLDIFHSVLYTILSSIYFLENWYLNDNHTQMRKTFNINTFIIMYIYLKIQIQCILYKGVNQ